MLSLDEKFALVLQTYAEAEEELMTLGGNPPPNATASLHAMLNQAGPFAEQTLFFGIGDDHLPLVLELNEPAAGAILTVGDSLSPQRRILRTMLHSAVRENRPHLVSLGIISPALNSFTDFNKLPHTVGMAYPYQREAEDLLYRACELTEARRNGRQDTTPAFLLVCDDLCEYWQNLDNSAQRSLMWLMEHGSKNAVWTIFSLKAQQVRDIPWELLKLLPTRLLTRIERPQTAAIFAGGDLPLVQQIDPELQFVTALGETWFTFNLPEDV
ncbi:MAG: hypothetical protein OHK0052_17530 [Anaerolineales bacterium]